MMRRGRPSKGLDHIEKLEGEPEQKERLRVVLATLTGETTVRAAAETLGLSETRVHELRDLALRGALLGLAPRRMGRPPKVLPAGSTRVEELEQEVQDLKDTLLLSQLRTEIALTMPQLLKDRGDLPEGEEKGGPTGRAARRKSQRAGRKRMKIRR